MEVETGEEVMTCPSLGVMSQMYLKVDEIDPESLKTQGQPHPPITRVLMSRRRYLTRSLPVEGASTSRYNHSKLVRIVSNKSGSFLVGVALEGLPFVTDSINSFYR